MRLPDRSVREEALVRDDYNLFGLRSEEVYVDLLTDSGTGAMSAAQWAALMMALLGVRRGEELLRPQDAVKEILGFDYVIPAHQARGRETSLFGTLVKRRHHPIQHALRHHVAHILNVGARPVDCVVDEAFDLASDYPFKGNVDNREVGSCHKPSTARRISHDNGHRYPITQVVGSPSALQNIRDVSQVSLKIRHTFFLVQRGWL
jgi:tryptophanase